MYLHKISQYYLRSFTDIFLEEILFLLGLGNIFLEKGREGEERKEVHSWNLFSESVNIS